MKKEDLKKTYKWLFSGQKKRVVNGKREFYTVEFDPIIEDAGSHWRIYKQKDSSPLILSKDYEGA